MFGHHKGGVEPHAKLADDVGGVVLAHLLLELQRAAAGDGAQVVLQLLLGHADAVIGDGEGAVLFVRCHSDGKVRRLYINAAIAEGQIGQLVNGVAGVGNDLPQENLFVGINGIDHQVHQPFGLGLKLFFLHEWYTSNCMF